VSQWPEAERELRATSRERARRRRRPVAVVAEMIAQIGGRLPGGGPTRDRRLRSSGFSRSLHRSGSTEPLSGSNESVAGFRKRCTVVCTSRHFATLPVSVELRLPKCARQQSIQEHVEKQAALSPAPPLQLVRGFAQVHSADRLGCGAGGVIAELLLLRDLGKHASKQSLGVLCGGAGACGRRRRWAWRS